MKTDHQMDQLNRDYTLRDIFVLLFKNKYRIISVCLLVITVTAIKYLTTPPAYEGKSILLVKGDQGGILSEIQILTSKDSIRRVIRELKLAKVYPDLAKAPPAKVDPLELATLRFQKELQAQRPKDSSIIEVTFRNSDPNVAASAVNLLVEVFKQRRLQLFSEGRSTFTEMQLASHESKLQKYEKQINDYKKKTELYSAEQQREQLLEQLSLRNNEISDTSYRIVQLENKIPVLRGRNHKLAEAAARKAESEQAKTLYEARLRLVNMKIEEQQMLMQYPESNPKIVAFRKQMQLVTDFIADQERQYGKAGSDDVAFQNAETELKDAQSELRSQRTRLLSLRRESQRLGDELRALEQNANDLQRWKRELGATERGYQTYLDKVEDGRIAEDAERRKLDGIKVVQEATPPLEPVEPNLMKAVASGAILALVAGLGVVLIFACLDRTLGTPEAAERRLGLRVLLSVPLLERVRRRGWLARRSAEKGGSRGDEATQPSGAAVPVKVGAAQRFSTTRHMQGLYRDLECLVSPAAAKTIVFTGSKGGEGVSSMVREFAAAAARLNKKRVLILDAAHCNPSQHIHFRIDPNYGWIDAFRNNEPAASACYTLDHPGLFLSPICSQPTLAPWCNEEASSAAFFRELKKDFDYILIDSSPVRTSPDCATICRFCDGVIMVIDSKSNWRAADKAKRKIVENGGTILGLIYNKRRFYIPGWIYQAVS